MHTEESLMALAAKLPYEEWRDLRDAIREVLEQLAFKTALVHELLPYQERAVKAEAECERLRTLLLRSKRGHYYCEDSWYSCPKEPESGCSDESQGTECNCGADKWNAEVDAAMQEKQPRFKVVYCSQCGGAFGPGDHGYSHCSDHAMQEKQP